MGFETYMMDFLRLSDLIIGKSSEYLHSARDSVSVKSLPKNSDIATKILQYRR